MRARMRAASSGPTPDDADGTERGRVRPGFRPLWAAAAALRFVGREQLGDDFDRLLAARHYLRVHGQQLCRRSAPRCDACVLRNDCAFGQSVSRVD